MMEVNMKVIMLMERNKVKVFILGQMDQDMMENGMIIKYVVKEFINGQMEDVMMGNG